MIPKVFFFDFLLGVHLWLQFIHFIYKKTAMFISPLPSVPLHIMQLRPRKEWTSFATIFPLEFKQRTT